jgi:hypothetical protein
MPPKHCRRLNDSPNRAGAIRDPFSDLTGVGVAGDSSGAATTEKPPRGPVSGRTYTLGDFSSLQHTLHIPVS